MTSNLTRADAADGLAASAPAESTLHVVFKVADCEYMLSAATVLLMESFSGVTRVPGAQPFVAGVVQIRGRVVPVVDLRVRFGYPAGPAVLDNRIVVGQHGDRVVGLLVDSAREVVKIPPSQLKPAPPILSHQGGGFVKAVAQVGTRVIMVVDFAKVIGEEPLHGSD
ncbi:MAG TPA: chemotaxis protein CheW [Polyangiaceae bacterium]|jgi:purine-binding chemotaxis protein CheW